ncbi:MAG TPA: amidase [Pyrinomonadaceae bacterium]|nr:amidase [Pyrinomonadaceae bacterium]
MSDELTRLSAARAAELIRGGELSPVELVGAYLRRVESLNPRLNAVVTLAPDVLKLARKAEAAVARGESVGPLHGVPVTVKDTIEVRGVRTTRGSRVDAERVPTEDATAVARLRAAGAIILGKTNCAELALEYTAENLVFGRTNNPHDLSRSPGGSSGGCAAAVAACLTAASLGSDLAGSIRIPAHFCGVAGLKPTAGRVPGYGHAPPVAGPYALGASLGPLARSVEDLELLFGVLADDNAPGVEVESLRGARAAFCFDDGVVPANEEIRSAVVRASEALREAGLLVEEERPPSVERANAAWLGVFSYATARYLREFYGGREDEAGPAARALLKRYVQEPDAEQFLASWHERDSLRNDLLRWMERTPLVVAPVGPVEAFGHEESRKLNVGGEVFPTFRAFALAQAFNVYDLPAVCVPAGRTRGGLPVGVQIVGRPFEERRVLAAARVVERALGGWQPPPEFV